VYVSHKYNGCTVGQGAAGNVVHPTDISKLILHFCSCSLCSHFASFLRSVGDLVVLTSRRNPGAISISINVLILIRKESYVDCVLIESL
jgi:hypothetical protein